MTQLFHTLDLHFQGVPETIAAYLFLEPEPTLIETGPGSTLSNLIAALSTHGLQPSDIRHLLVSHIHLDHAGAAGWWAQQGTTVYVHEVGAPHLIDPSKLLASASRIYGDQMDVLWGETVPAPAKNVVALTDGQVVQIGDLAFEAIDTPGHAWHHMIYGLDDLAFTGDAAGMRLNKRPFADLPAPPPEFKLEVWQATIDKIRQRNFSTIYPTHFGRVDAVTEHLDAFSHLLTDAASFIQVRMAQGMSRGAILADYERWDKERALATGISEADFDKYVTANPLYMSVDGIMRYWHKKGVGSDVS